MENNFLALVLIITNISLIFMVLLIIIASPESRKVFLSFYKKIFKSKRHLEEEKIKEFSDKLASVLEKLSKDSVGAIITVENKNSLTQYAKTGHQVQTDFSAEFVYSIFYNKKSPLHDGAIIVKQGEIIAVSCYFPTSNRLNDVSYGARHRAALGISEITDSVTYVVSETNGKIRAAKSGRIDTLPSEKEEILIYIKNQLGYKFIN